MSLNMRNLLQPGCDLLQTQAEHNETVAKYLHLRDADLSEVPIVYLYQQLAIELAEENNRLRKTITVEPIHDNIRMTIELPVESFSHMLRRDK